MNLGVVAESYLIVPDIPFPWQMLQPIGPWFRMLGHRVFGIVGHLKAQFKAARRSPTQLFLRESIRDDLRQAYDMEPPCLGQ